MERVGWMKAARPTLAWVALGALLTGCGGGYTGGSGYYGGGYPRGPGYYGSPYYGGYDYGGYGRYRGYDYRGYDRFSGPRRHYGGGSVERPPPFSARPASPPQDRLGQFWRGELPRTPPQDRLGQFWRGQLPPR